MKKRFLGAGVVLAVALCILYAAQAAGEVTNFNYSASRQSFTAPVNGKYQVELWGAAGGDTSARQGGKGKLISGVVQLSAGETVYIYTGGKDGTNALNGTYASGSVAEGARGGGDSINKG